MQWYHFLDSVIDWFATDVREVFSSNFRVVFLNINFANFILNFINFEIEKNNDIYVYIFNQNSREVWDEIYCRFLQVYGTWIVTSWAVLTDLFFWACDSVSLLSVNRRPLYLKSSNSWQDVCSVWVLQNSAIFTA